jgi:signal transduction histidine kinase
MLRLVRPRIAAPIGVAAVSAAATALVILHPDLRFAFGQPELQAALETAASLVALLAGFLAIGRLRRQASLTDFMLAWALGVIALSNLCFALVLPLAGFADSNFAAWLAIISRSLGSLLFGVTAFVPGRRIRRLGWAQVAVVAAVTGSLALTVLADWSLYAHLPAAISPAARPHPSVLPVLHADPGLLSLEMATAALDLVAAVGYLARSRRPAGGLASWLAVAAVFAAAAHLNYFLYPSVYARVVSVGDTFRLCFYGVLLAGSIKEIWSYWLGLSQTTLAVERRRIARDLHDGLAQELAYLTRNLDALAGPTNGPMERETLDRLRQATERARLASRLAVSDLAFPNRHTLADAFADSVRDVADRLGVDLGLEISRNVRLPAAHSVALVRIASEAITNAARHSGARTVSMSVRRVGSQTRLQVADDGAGFDPAGRKAGFGLVSMREHASSVGGRLRVSSSPGVGTLVEATL